MDTKLVQRRSQRNPVVIPAKCRTQSGMRDDGWLSDISAEGCCVTSNGLFFCVGTRVVIRPQGLEGLSGVIRWIRGSTAGILFDAPLYGPIVDHLSATHAAGRMVSITGA